MLIVIPFLSSAVLPSFSAIFLSRSHADQSKGQLQVSSRLQIASAHEVTLSLCSSLK